MKTQGTEGTPATERYRHHHEQVRNKSRDVVMPTAVSATEGMAFNISDASKRMDSCKSRGKSNVRKTSTAGTPATAGTTEVAGLPETLGKSITTGTSVRA